MPDFLAHSVFGEMLMAVPQVQPAIPGERELAPWRWGLQGPDPFFFRTSTSPAGGMMHRGAPEGMFQAMAARLALLQGPVRDTAAAWLHGFLGHYILDRTVHPYVLARQEELAPLLPGASGNACHYQVETDMDAALCLHFHHQPVSAFRPGRGMTLESWQKETIAGMLAAGAAAKGAMVPVLEGIKALESTAMTQQIIFRGGKPALAAARGLELLMGKNRQFTSHMKGRRPGWDSLNLGHAPWTDPRDGSTRTQSVPELLQAALAEALPLMEALSRQLAGEESGELALGRVDFSGFFQR